MTSERMDCHLDASVPIHAASERNGDPHRSPLARQLLPNRFFGVSGQTMAELVAVARTGSPLDDAALDQSLVFAGTCPSVAVDGAYLRSGLEFARRHGIGCHDAALLAAAERLGAPVSYSEDVSHGQQCGSVRVVNPFM